MSHQNPHIWLLPEIFSDTILSQKTIEVVGYHLIKISEQFQSPCHLNTTQKKILKIRKKGFKAGLGLKLLAMLLLVIVEALSSQKGDS